MFYSCTYDEEIYLDNDVYDRSYGIIDEDKITISSTTKTSYVCTKDISASDGNGDLNLVKSIKYNDARDIDVKQVYTYDHKILMFTYASQSIGSKMWIFSLLEK